MCNTKLLRNLHKESGHKSDSNGIKLMGNGRIIIIQSYLYLYIFFIVFVSKAIGQYDFILNLKLLYYYKAISIAYIVI